MRGYMMSFLARQHLVLGKRFTQRYPHAWLVWEPGAWKAPPLDVATATTQLPTRGGRPSKPEEGDALCFELDPTKAAQLKIGRAGSNDVVLNDVTVSREHCVLKFDGRRWGVTAAPAASTLVVASVPLVTGSQAALLSGDCLKLGDVRLTFLSAHAFGLRVAAGAAALGSPAALSA